MIAELREHCSYPGRNWYTIIYSLKLCGLPTSWTILVLKSVVAFGLIITYGIFLFYFQKSKFPLLLSENIALIYMISVEQQYL